MTTDVVVTGRREKTSTGGVVFTAIHYPSSPDEHNVNSYNDSENQDPDKTVVKVNVKVGNSSNTDKATEAARNIAEAVSLIIAVCKGLPSGTVIPLPNNRSTTVGALLSNIEATKFTVTDNPNSRNGGVGGADHPTMTDQLYFAAFAEGTGQSSYSNAGYAGQGLVGTILHELGHLSSEGYANFNYENTKFQNEMAARHIPQNQRAFYGEEAEDYALDVESFAQQYALGAASALGLDISTYDAILRDKGEVADYLGADFIYNEHMNG